VEYPFGLIPTTTRLEAFTSFNQLVFLQLPIARARFQPEALGLLLVEVQPTRQIISSQAAELLQELATLLELGSDPSTLPVGSRFIQVAPTFELPLNRQLQQPLAMFTVSFGTEGPRFTPVTEWLI
jgi:hypothetical protein